MSPPTQDIEEPTPAANPEGGSNLPRIPRKIRDDAIRVLMDLGYCVTGDEAYGLIRAFQRWRRADARRFVIDEFRVFVQRRGDLLQVRGRSLHEWRLHT